MRKDAQIGPIVEVAWSRYQRNTSLHDALKRAYLLINCQHRAAILSPILNPGQLHAGGTACDALYPALDFLTVHPPLAAYLPCSRLAKLPEITN